MDRSAVNETMETLRRKVKEDHLEERELFCCASIFLS
jgi:hypothetical protein